MTVLHDFEHRLEGAVEGFFARLFRSGVQPLELAKAVQRYARMNQHVTDDGIVVPNVYRVVMGSKDHDRLSGFGASLPRELAEVVARTAVEHDWRLRGPVRVRIELDDTVRFGRYRVTGRIEVVDAPTPPQPEPDAEIRPDLQHTQIVYEAPHDAPTLRVTAGGNHASSPPLLLVAARYTIGRAATCDLVIANISVSREHAAVVRRAERYWLIDLGSTNGTLVNGRRTAEHPLTSGDRIGLGDVTVTFDGS